MKDNFKATNEAVLYSAYVHAIPRTNNPNKVVRMELEGQVTAGFIGQFIVDQIGRAFLIRLSVDEFTAQLCQAPILGLKRKTECCA